MQEIIQVVVVIVGVYVALMKVTSGLQKSLDDLTTEVRGLLLKVTRIDATYVTEEECSVRREKGLCHGSK
jgi:hypothetical protein